MSHEQMVVVVSGGSRGLGQALVTELLRRGQRVAAFSRTATEFTESCRHECAEDYYWESVDAAEPEGIAAFVNRVVARFGRLDALVNNAAVGSDGMLTLMRPEEVRRTLAVNLEGVLYLTQRCLRVMLARGSGSVVSITSVLGVRGFSGSSVYGAAKAAVDSMTRSLAREVGPRGIRVNAVAPGYFPSDMVRGLDQAQVDRLVRRTPLGRLATAADVTGVVCFLLSPEAGFITGQTLVVDGGFTC